MPQTVITDNVVITFKTIHFMKSHNQGNHGWVALKTYISKAYDWIHWNFLHTIMLKLGFVVDWVDLIMLCVITLRCFVCFNGSEVGPIQPYTGILSRLICLFYVLKGFQHYFIGLNNNN